jgi:RNA polymerase subunit RPABC4/transcription elongation factor Spt4
MEIKWRQDKSNKLIISVAEDSFAREFQLEESLVGYLTIHKLVHIYIKLKDVDEQNSLINFNGIKPISRDITSFGGKMLTKETHQQALQDKCAIARGDTFASKWLTPKGWSTEKHYFSLEPFQTDHPPAKIACLHCGKMIPLHSKFCGYCGQSLSETSQKNCINKDCGKMIKDTARFCPYCGIKQQ